MSGAPSEAEIRTQWVNIVDLLEETRNFADGTMAGAGNVYDTLLQSLEGEFLPSSIIPAVQSHRSSLSDLVSPETARTFLEPVLFEYGRVITDFGGGYEGADDLMRALYDWFVTNTITVQSRAITYDTSGTYPATNSGGAGPTTGSEFSRLTVDENNYNLEACTVEKKIFRCVRDQNSGVKEHAEVFEFLGAQASQDSLLRSTFGSGQASNVNLTVRHAGTGPAGSLLRNSSFSTFSATATPKFTGWTQAFTGGAAAGDIGQDTTNYYRSHPNAASDASLELTAPSSGNITLSQTIDDLSGSTLDPNTPYFLRVMANRAVGSATGGDLVLRLGSQVLTTQISSLSDTAWSEVVMPIDTNSWFRNFNEDGFTIEIEWASSSSGGTLLVDDVIFAPMQLIDGTFWIARQNQSLVAGTYPNPWLLDDEVSFTDTGGAPSTGKLQWWLWVSGFGYLPSSGTPTISDPT